MDPQPPPHRPELLAPAGDAACAQAAVEHGADAVYFGLRGGLNARVRATNFAPAELPELMAMLHRHDVRGYLTLNTLVFPEELETFETAVRAAVAAGVDAVLVQDLGAVRLLRAIAPAWPIHASTQMSLTSAEGIRVAAQLGIQRVVLARELSLADIRQIRQSTRVGLEVFVHGALCIAYSGQCLASLAMGGRSGNRGQCAQACRLPYELVCDGQARDLGPRKYLLSPQDLAALELLPELLAAGVDALKIEGRLKSAHYVAVVTGHYRRALDAIVEGKRGHAPFVRSTLRAVPANGACPLFPASAEAMDEMALSFSRGFSHGWLQGPAAGLVHGESPTKRGVCVGRVCALRRGRVGVHLTAAVKRGDGLLFAGDFPQGGRIYGVFRAGQAVPSTAAGEEVELSFARDALQWDALRVGQEVWKTDDPHLRRALGRTTRHESPPTQTPVDLVVEAAVGQPLRIAARTATGSACRVESSDPLAAALRHPLSVEVLRAQLGRWGGTPYVLRELTARIEGQPMVPLSVLGQLRRELLARLAAACPPRPVPALAASSPLAALRAEAVGESLPLPLRERAGVRGKIHGQSQCHTEWHVLCRAPGQVQAALAGGVASLMADFADLEACRTAVASAHRAAAEIYLAAPRMQKPGEMALLAALVACGADGLLVRNLAAAAFCAEQGVPFVADFSLHAANELTVHYLRTLGASRVTAAYDLDRGQLLALAAAVPPGLLEVVVYQHLPMFHTEYCLFCSTLTADGLAGDRDHPSPDPAHCGRPCRRHAVRLRDRLGVEHPVAVDAACRNTVYHAKAQTLFDLLPPLTAQHVRHFRLEFMAGDTPAHVARVLRRQQLG